MTLVISDETCFECPKSPKTNSKTNLLQFCKRCSASFCENHIQTHLKTKKCPECKDVVCIEWFATKFMLDPKSTSYEFRWCFHCNVRSQLLFLLRNKDCFKPTEQKELLKVTDKVITKFYGNHVSDD